jgi:hypothetical protein
MESHIPEDCKFDICLVSIIPYLLNTNRTEVNINILESKNVMKAAP